MPDARLDRARRSYEPGQPNKPGRPTVAPGEVSADVHLTIPVSLYDRAYSAASRARISVPEVIRRALVKDLET